MSMHADIIDVAKRLHTVHKLTKEEAAAIYSEILGALEWDFYDELEGDWTPEKDLEAAMKDLWS